MFYSKNGKQLSTQIPASWDVKKTTAFVLSPDKSERVPVSVCVGKIIVDALAARPVMVRDAADSKKILVVTAK